MRVQFWGAARSVTGSVHLLEVDGCKLLLECGLYQGSRKKAFERNRDLPFKARMSRRRGVRSGWTGDTASACTEGDSRQGALDR